MQGIPGGLGCGERRVVQQWAFAEQEDAAASAHDLARQRRERAKFIWKPRRTVRAEGGCRWGCESALPSCGRFEVLCNARCVPGGILVALRPRAVLHLLW